MRQRKRRSSGPVGQLACGAGLGAALCLLLTFWVTTTAARPARLNDRGTLASPGTPSARIASPEEARVVLAALKLPLACFRAADSGAEPWKAAPASQEAAAPRAAGVLLCCTHCHNAGEPNRPAVSAVALLQREACGACHRWQ
jgi:hypothetical protein